MCGPLSGRQRGTISAINRHEEDHEGMRSRSRKEEGHDDSSLTIHLTIFLRMRKLEESSISSCWRGNALVLRWSPACSPSASSRVSCTMIVLSTHTRTSIDEDKRLCRRIRIRERRATRPEARDGTRHLVVVRAGRFPVLGESSPFFIVCAVVVSVRLPRDTRHCSTPRDTGSPDTLVLVERSGFQESVFCFFSQFLSEDPWETQSATTTNTYSL